MGDINYAIADDHKIFRQGLKIALKDEHLHCIGEAGNGKELLTLLADNKVDIVLLDLKMPDMDGIETTKQLREKYPDVKILILTMFDDEHFIIHLMEAGASGYLLKNAEPAEIKLAIHAAMENGYYFNDLVSSTMLKNLMNKTKRPPTFKETVELNDKERTVLQLICEQYTAAEIAEKIFLSPRTVEGIRSTLLEKVGVRNLAGLVMYAVKSGIVK